MQQMRSEADSLLREAEKLVSAPSSRLARAMWRAQPSLAAPKFSSAANKFAYCGSTDLAKMCFVKAADCYSETSQHYSAGQHLEKAFHISLDQTLLLRCGEEFAAAGQAATGAEATSRGAKKIDDVEAMMASIDYADVAGPTMRSIEVARASVVWLSGRKIERALEKVDVVFGMMDAVGVEVTEPIRARLVAAVVILRLLSSSLEDAEASFLRELPDFGATTEAGFVDDLLAACKKRDLDALKEVVKPSRVSILDFEIAALVRDLANPHCTKPGWWGAQEEVSNEQVSQSEDLPAAEEDDDDLPDLT